MRLSQSCCSLFSIHIVCLLFILSHHTTEQGGNITMNTLHVEWSVASPEAEAAPSSVEWSWHSRMWLHLFFSCPVFLIIYNSGHITVHQAHTFKQSVSFNIAMFSVLHMQFTSLMRSKPLLAQTLLFECWMDSLKSYPPFYLRDSPWLRWASFFSEEDCNVLFTAFTLLLSKKMEWFAKTEQWSV